MVTTLCLNEPHTIFQIVEYHLQQSIVLLAS